MKSSVTTVTLLLALAVLLTGVAAMVTDATTKRTKTEVRKLVAGIKSAPTRTAVIKSAKRLTRAMRASGGCKAAFCVAMEGSKVIPAKTYALQQTLTALTAAVVSADTRSAFGAVQYSTSTSPITPMVTALPKFLKSVAKSKQTRKPKSNLSGGLGYCWFQLRRNKNKVKAVVLMGTGDFNTGFPPKIVVDSIAKDKKSDGRILNVLSSGGKPNYVSNIGGSKKDVINLKNENQLAAALEAVVGNICDVSL